MRNIKVFMAYRGTRYHGFQRQDNAVTIQQTVEDCIEMLLKEKVAINGCSRTDAGVHANQFCFNFKTEHTIPCVGFLKGMNNILPPDISILDCEDTDNCFHPRFDTKSKEYLYKIHNAVSKNPFMDDLALHYNREIDVDLLKKAAKEFIGQYDFKAFCAAGSTVKDTVREIYSFEVIKNGYEIDILVKGNGFLYNMVRILVGTLLYVNEGRIKVDEIKDIIMSKDRKRAGITVPPQGLYLNKVSY